MNYTQETLRELQVLGQKNPELELGDLLFTAFQKEAVKHGKSLDFLRHIKAEDLYTLVYQSTSEDLRDNAMSDEEWELWTAKK